MMRAPGWGPPLNLVIALQIFLSELRELEGGLPKVELHASCKTRQSYPVQVFMISSVYIYIFNIFYSFKR
jgi:hypothetical protein